MIILLHGENTERSRNELIRIKDAAKNKEFRILDGKSVDETGLTQALQSSSLFGGETLVIIENLFGKLGRKTTLIKTLCALIVSSSETTDIVLWEDKEVGTTALKALGKADVRLFAIPVVIFQFLDGIRPGNTKQLLSLYDELVSQEAPELIHAMIVRRWRQLIQLAGGSAPPGLQTWQISRLTTQAKSFTMEKLLAMYNALLTSESSIKTGMSPFSLSEHTKQFLISLT